MDVHSAPVAAKRMWGYLRAVFFMMRKGKRKLLLGAHLLMKRRHKAVSRSVANLLSHHHHHHHSGRALRRRDYEFSCRDNPDPGSFSMRRLAFPCLGAATDDVADHHPAPASPPRHMIEYYANAAAASPAPSSPGALMTMHEELALGEERTPAGMSPLVPNAADGGFSVRVSNFSAEEAELGGEAVDDEAEEFIARFYDQLRRQNHVGLLPCHYHLQEAAA